MRLTAFLLSIVLLPSLAAADGLATMICVLDAPTYGKLIKEYGKPALIPTEVLSKGAIHQSILKDACDSTFKQGDQSYRLLAAHRGNEGKLIYSISQETEGKPSHLLCVGAVSREGAKEDTADDPMVVVLREGDFLRN